MIGSEKVFFDTSPFIYLIEDNPNYSLKVRNFISEQIVNYESTLYTSSLTLAEFYVKPKQNNSQEIIEKFKNKLRELDFKVFDITSSIAKFSADLRAKYKTLKSFDAIQLATAISFGCNKFLTNDLRLVSVIKNEIEIVIVENLK